MVTSGSTGSCGGAGLLHPLQWEGNEPERTGTSLGLQEESALYPHHTYPKGRGHKSVCARQGPLPCLLPNAHLDLTLASLSGRGRTQEPLLHSAEHLWGSRALTL